MALASINGYSGDNYDGIDSRCACGQGTCVNDVHLVVLTGELIASRDGGARSVSNFEKSHGNVVEYTLGRGLAVACRVVVEDQDVFVLGSGEQVEG